MLNIFTFRTMHSPVERSTRTKRHSSGKIRKAAMRSRNWICYSIFVSIFLFFFFFFSDEKPITRSILLPRLLFLPPRFHEGREEREEGGSLMYLFLDKVLSSSYLERSWTQLHATQHRYVHTLTSRKSCGFLLCWLSSNWSSFVTLRNCLEDASRFSHGNCESTCRVNASQCASRI